MNQPRPGALEEPYVFRYDPGPRIGERRLEHEGAATMRVSLKTLDPMRVAFVRHIGPYAKCARAWETLCTLGG